MQSAILLPHVKKNHQPCRPSRIGAGTRRFQTILRAERDLERTAVGDAWQRIKDAALDMSDDGLHNGSAA